MGGFAWVTLATNDSYSLGALVLAHSLRRVNTAHQLVVLITPGVTEAMKTQLSAVFNLVKLVDVLDSGDADNLALLARPDLGITFTKLHCWKLTQYDKCVFLDADTLVLQNSDELFEREELSAAPDAGWPDCFNSGVFVYKPSNDTFNALIEFALVHGSFDGGDQGLLNLFFSDWATKDIKKHLPFIYNMVSTSTYSYLPAFKQFGHGLKILHFIGSAKPWLHPFNTETGLVQSRGESSQHVTQFLQLWWDLFCTTVHPSLSTEMSRHRLSSSYDFSASQSASSMQPFPSIESHHSEPSQLNHSDNEAYTYFDPWDDVKETDPQVSCESFQNFKSSLDNCLDTNSSSEVNFSDQYTEFSDVQTNYNDHYTEFSDSQSSHKFVSEYRDTSSTPQNSKSHSGPSKESETVQYSNHTDRLPTAEVLSEPLQSLVPINDGGGDTRLRNRPSRRDSFSLPEQRISAPDIRVPENHIVLEMHSHALPSSVVSPIEQEVTHAPLPEPEAGLAGALATVKLGAPISAEQAALEEHLRRQGWEQGNIDYMGKDSFSNIWQKICDTLAGTRVTPVDTPAPVAPVAAPTYVSSVEISPTGPIDTSPPASYAPVSATKPTTIVASDTEAVTAVAASAETTAVVPEPKSPSVAELISTSAALDSAAKPQSPSSEATSETSMPLLESITSVALLPSAGTQDPKTTVSEVTTQIITPLEVPPTTTTIENISPEIPISQLETTKIITESPTKIQPVQAPTPLAITPTETIVQTPVPLPSSQTEALFQTPTPPPSTPASKSVTDPLISQSAKIPIPLPSTPTEAPAQVPVSLPPTSTSIAPVPTKDADSTIASPPQTPAQPEAQAVPQVPDISQSSKLSTCLASETDSLITSPSLPLTPPSTPPTSQITSIATPPSKATPEQPSTPTITEATPPTSPPVGAVESPLAAKLQIEPEVPATPPVGESSSPPVLSKVPSDEPPVPPKRKGGSKTSQEVKGQKGKPAKGKK